MSNNTHAHYLASLPGLAKNAEDENWLLQHASRYIDQHGVHTTDCDGHRMHILDDQSAVTMGPDQWYEPTYYRDLDFPQINFGPSPEDRARWQYETFTNQDYAGVHDLTKELRDVLRKTAAVYQPGSRNRTDFLETLELVEEAWRRITYKNGAPISKWLDWVKDRRIWLESQQERYPVREASHQAHMTDIETMLALLGPMPAQNG